MNRTRKRATVTFEKAAMAALGKIPGLEKDLKRVVRLNAHWPDIVGPLLVNQVILLRLKQDIAVLGVRDHVFATELEYMQDILVGKINEVLRTRPIARIQCRVIHTFPGDAAAAEVDPFAPPGPQPDAGPALSAESRKKLEETLAQVEDPELRAQLERLFTKSRARHGE